jgi:hypothetical protein
MTALFIPNAILIETRQNKYSFASFMSRDTTFDVIHNIWRLARPSDAVSLISSGRESVDQVGMGGIMEGTTVGAGEEGVVVGGNVVGKVKKKVTQCACGKAGEHFTETALDAVFPGTPDRIHNLIFASGFMKDFLAVNQKLTGKFGGFRLTGRNLLTICYSRYPDGRLVPHSRRFSFARKKHVVHQAAKCKCRTQVYQMRDPGRDALLRL